jgi:hypothetical protein
VHLVVRSTVDKKSVHIKVFIKAFEELYLIKRTRDSNSFKRILY